jgi:hypothetical protein
MCHVEELFASRGGFALRERRCADLLAIDAKEQSLRLKKSL